MEGCLGVKMKEWPGRTSRVWSQHIHQVGCSMWHHSLHLASSMESVLVPGGLGQVTQFSHLYKWDNNPQDEQVQHVQLWVVSTYLQCWRCCPSLLPSPKQWDQLQESGWPLWRRGRSLSPAEVGHSVFWYSDGTSLALRGKSGDSAESCSADPLTTYLCRSYFSSLRGKNLLYSF